jgi:DNA-binding NarL/FixJ family response regulator
LKKILIYDKLFFYGRGLHAVIKSNFTELEVILVFSPNIFLEECCKNVFDIVIFDFINDKTLSFQELKKIKKLQPNSKLFVMSEIDSVDFKTQCSKSHVDYLLSKDCSEVYLVAALKLALYGNSYFTKNLRLNIPERKAMKKGSIEPKINNTLSPREYEVAMLMVKGYSTKNISEKLNIVSTTISTYKKRIFEKTNSSNIIDIAKILDVL